MLDNQSYMQVMFITDISMLIPLNLQINIRTILYEKVMEVTINVGS